MDDNLDTLRSLHAKLLSVDLDGEEADAIRDQMDGPWYALTEEEREQYRKQLAEEQRDGT